MKIIYQIMIFLFDKLRKCKIIKVKGANQILMQL